jgi:CRP-like cAMP-binding protein
MKTTDLVDRLVEHKTLGTAPREELAWLASHGSLQQLNAGDVLTAKGERVEGLFVVLSGRIAIFVDRGAGPHKIMEWRGGDVTGLLPYSRLVSPPSDTVAHEPSEILAVPRDCLRAMTRECSEITAILVHSMLDRARVFNSSDLQDEKMVSLGKLSAGLAHELNNPASAIERSAVLLEDRLEDSERAARARRDKADRLSTGGCRKGSRVLRGHERAGRAVAHRASRARGSHGRLARRSRPR